MKTLALALPLLLSATGCTLYFGDDGAPPPGDDQPPPPTDEITTYRFTKVKAIAGEMPIVGVDSDQAGGAWIAYRKPTANYYDNAEVHVVHVDASGAKTSDWTYDDEYTLVQGIAFDGTNLWLNYNSNTTADNNHLRKLDPANGDTLAVFATEAGIIDVTTRSNTLVLSSPWNELVTLDRTTGGEMTRTPVDTFMYSTQMGVAAWSDKTWVVGRASAELSLADASGKRIARGLTDELADFNYENIRLGWDSSTSELLMAIHNQVLWLSAAPESTDGVSCGGAPH